MASKRIEDALALAPMSMHLQIGEVPELGEVCVRVAMNAAQPPAEPGFRAHLSYDVLEQLLEGELQPQQAFFGGKLRLEGNYAPALQLAMQLAQPAR